MMNARMVCSALLLCYAAPVLAGDGPWTLDPSTYNLYLGVDYFRYTQFNIGSFEPNPPPAATTPTTPTATTPTATTPTATTPATEAPPPPPPGAPMTFSPGITGYALNGIWTVGLRRGLEGELKLSIESARVNNPNDPMCGHEMPKTPEDWCEPTAGLGDLFGSLKWRALDEFSGAPFTAALSGKIRSGEPYASRRRRVTTLGDGATDVGGALSFGRKASMGVQSLRVYASGTYFYRFPNAKRGNIKVPADEVSGEAELIWSFVPSFEIGPTVVAFSRLDGVDIDDVDFFEYDAWNQTRAAQVKVGAKLAVFSILGRTVSLSALRTVHARNNPTDTISISLGAGQLLRAQGTR